MWLISRLRRPDPDAQQRRLEAAHQDIKARGRTVVDSGHDPSFGDWIVSLDDSYDPLILWLHDWLSGRSGAESVSVQANLTPHQDDGCAPWLHIDDFRIHNERARDNGRGTVMVNAMKAVATRYGAAYLEGELSSVDDPPRLARFYAHRGFTVEMFSESRGIYGRTGAVGYSVPARG